MNTNEKYNNTKRAVYTPLFAVLLVAAGIFIGYNFIPQKTNFFNSSINLNRQDKISAIIRLIEENYVDKIPTDSLEELVIPEILQKLDPHSSYFPPKVNLMEHERLEGNFDGIGVQFNIQNDTVLIVLTISGGPSEKVGVLAGDRIITVNDTVIAGVGITNDGVMKLLKGPKNSKVKIGVQRKGVKGLLSFEIKRDKIPLFSIDVSYMVSKDIGYIKISRFAGTTYSEFVDASKKLKEAGMKKLILDLRDNGGGYLNAAVDIADEFLPKGKTIVYTQGAFRDRVDYTSTDNDLLKDVETVVLINAWTASASEIVAGALQDNDRALIIGRRSFGKGLVQEEFGFNDNSAVRITIARYYTPVGRCIQKPYTNGYDAYYEDAFMTGEVHKDKKDSLPLPDSLKYKTPAGKIVYGGGGITPDIIIPVDTSGYSNFLFELTARGLIYKYALEYTDKYRVQLNKLKTYKEISDYLIKNNVLSSFMTYVSKSGLKYKTEDYLVSKTIIHAQLRANIARNILDNEGFYPIIKEIDDELLKALDVLNQ
jgi:carboxyl-terminal processing protease